MRYATARYHSQRRDMAYRIYVCDALRTISESSAMRAGGPYMSARFIDTIKPRKKDTRSGEEIVVDVFGRMGVEII